MVDLSEDKKLKIFKIVLS